jgi:hypothetical protein
MHYVPGRLAVFFYAAGLLAALWVIGAEENRILSLAGIVLLGTLCDIRVSRRKS